MKAGGDRVVVIGSGIGGAGCAALLAKKGFDVTLLERNDYPGGKAASFEREGFVYDTGVHAFGNGEKGPLGEINRLVGGDLKWNIIKEGNRIAVGEHTVEFRFDYGSDDAIARLLEGIGVRGDNFDDCFACFKELCTMKPASEMEVLDETPVKEYVDRFTDDHYFHQMMNLMCGMLFAITYFTSSTGEFIYCMSQASENASLSYPIGAARAIPIAYLNALESMGGKVVYGAPVKGIIVEKGRAVGVDAGGGVPADIVVSNMGLQPTVRMVEEHLPPDYVERAMTLRSSYGAVSVKYALDEEVVDHPLTGWVPDVSDEEAMQKYVGLFCPVPSSFDPGLAPGGCQLVLAGAILSPDPKKKDLSRMVLDRIEATMEMLYPGIEDHIVWKLRTGVDYVADISGRDLGEVIGLSQDYRQVGRNRPSPRMPVAGLYLVGADAGGRGIGTEMAGDSAIKVSDMIEADLSGEADPAGG